MITAMFMHCRALIGCLAVPACSTRHVTPSPSPIGRAAATRGHWQSLAEGAQIKFYCAVISDEIHQSFTRRCAGELLNILFSAYASFYGNSYLDCA